MYKYQLHRFPLLSCRCISSLIPELAKNQILTTTSNQIGRLTLSARLRRVAWETLNFISCSPIARCRLWPVVPKNSSFSAENLSSKEGARWVPISRYTQDIDTSCSRTADGLQSLEDVRALASPVIRDPTSDGTF